MLQIRELLLLRKNIYEHYRHWRRLRGFSYWACLADVGNNILCLDLDKKFLFKNGKLHLRTDLSRLLKKINAQVDLILLLM